MEIKSVEDLRAYVEDSPFHDLMHTEIVDAGEGFAVCRMPVRDDLFHAGGVVHGGVTYALADTAVAMALVFNTNKPKVYTIEGKLNYLRAVSQNTRGDLYARADLIHLGRTTAVARASVTDGNDRTYCEGLFTYALG